MLTVPMDERDEGCLYFIQAVKLKKVKVGKAIEVKLRLSELQVGSPDKLVVVHKI
jgi:hypothetical protein